MYYGMLSIHLFNSGALSKGSLVVAHPPRKRGLGGVRVSPAPLWEEGHDHRCGAGEAEGTKDVGEGPGEGGGLGGGRDGRVAVDLEGDRVQLNHAISPNLR